ncbi:G-type lectin S-receptor-like serine/threonine-protein kinase CES101 [Cornus florida]|uniref:G-type lectin S-receptor-like serine/threonine-protein kinase CES101 n=1 Tax=Cornus florida TaxID=4283 RepID=UPI0028966D05|nr:G-type lectin S-receptor-like serine/threonine-protein kinase CES101 [Cornus florida]
MHHQIHSNQGDMLNSSTFLVSSRKIFSLGFFKPADSNNSYLGICYTNVTYKPVWIANRNTPINDNSGVVTIDRSGKLIITYSGGDPIELYVSQASTFINITATLLDTGNFVLREANSHGSTKELVLWESFDYPTDTLLPGMKLGVNHRTGKKWSLTSWFTINEPASGVFSLEWDPRVRRLVVRRRGVIHWTSGVLKDKAFEFIPKSDPIDLNYEFINVTNQEEEYFAYSLIIDPMLTPEHRRVVSGLVIDYMGQIHDQDRTMIARVDLCGGYNTEISEVNAGCELWEQPKCGNRHQYHLLTIIRALVSVLVETNVGMIVIVLVLGVTVLGVGLDAYFGEEIWSSVTIAVALQLLTKFLFRSLSTRLSLVQNPIVLLENFTLELLKLNAGGKKWIWIVTAVVVALLILLFGLLCFLRRRKIKLQGNEEKVLHELMTPNGYMNIDELEHDANKGHDLKVFSFACIMDATSSFSTECKLREGGFGPVYKEKLPEGQEIAVKRLSRSSGQGLAEFKNELIFIAQLQHMNLVRLLGCCIQGDEKMLVYVYMPNKSLDSFLFDTNKKGQLTWECRLSIIEGIAQGILYLHKYSRLRIIHRDLKASNILLDENMNPKNRYGGSYKRLLVSQLYLVVGMTWSSGVQFIGLHQKV